MIIGFCLRVNLAIFASEQVPVTRPVGRSNDDASRMTKTPRKLAFKIMRLEETCHDMIRPALPQFVDIAQAVTLANERL